MKVSSAGGVFFFLDLQCRGRDGLAIETRTKDPSKKKEIVRRQSQLK
jgi:hypothetical protein